MADDDRETSPETPAARLGTWPPRAIDERLAELFDAGATFTEAAKSLYFKHLRDATQDGLDACGALAADLRNEMDAMRLDLKRATDKVFELAQLNSLLRDEVHELRAMVRDLKGAA